VVGAPSPPEGGLPTIPPRTAQPDDGLWRWRVRMPMALACAQDLLYRLLPSLLPTHAVLRHHCGRLLSCIFWQATCTTVLLPGSCTVQPRVGGLVTTTKTDLCDRCNTAAEDAESERD
jgi:hypothetical protein